MINKPLAFVGRFQPFHADHWQLVRTLLDRNCKLYIGITNPDYRSLKQKTLSEHRHRLSANPFYFHERQAMIEAVLADNGKDRHQISIVPFPLDDASLWSHYIPKDAIQIVRVFSPWEKQKCELLKNGGYAVEELSGNQSTRVNASDIRAVIAADEPLPSSVPRAVVTIVNRIGCATLRQRMGRESDT